MVWLDSITELQYYNPIVGFPCYCELLVEPSDLAMQHVLPNVNGTTAIIINVYSADGLTDYGDYSSYFTTTVSINQIGQKYFQIQLNTFAPPMCENLCWILRVRFTVNEVVIFDKWSERFCNASCCATLGGITIEGDDGTTTVQTFEPAPAWADCGVPIVRLETTFDCYDKFTGEYYGNGFKKVTNIRGRYIRLPRTIEKTISLNCKVQKVQSARIYQLEGWDYYPEWKMDEIELQLQATTIKLNGETFIYTGGAPFSKPNICQDIYILNAQFKECDVWQIFGCAPCKTSLNTKYLRVPSADFYYSEDKELIGSTVEDIMVYYNSQNGVLSVEHFTTDGGEDLLEIDCEYPDVLKITSSGYIPTFIYVNGVLPLNKIYTVDEVEEVCVPVNYEPCITPDIGDIEVSVATCTTPEIGDITVEQQAHQLPQTADAIFDHTIQVTGDSFTDERMQGFIVMTIVTNGQAYNSAFFDKPYESDTLTSLNPDLLTFTADQVVTVFVRYPE